MAGIPWVAAENHLNLANADYFTLTDGMLYRDNLVNPTGGILLSDQIAGEFVSEVGQYLIVREKTFSSCRYDNVLNSYNLNGELLDSINVGCLEQDIYVNAKEDIVPLMGGNGVVVYRVNNVETGFHLTLHLLDESGMFQPAIEIPVPLTSTYRTLSYSENGNTYIPSLSEDGRLLSYGDLVYDVVERKPLLELGNDFIYADGNGFVSIAGGVKRQFSEVYVYPLTDYLKQLPVEHFISGVFLNPDGSYTLTASRYKSVDRISVLQTITVPDDVDGDGVPNHLDRFPNDPVIANDDDRDGIPNGWNPEYEDQAHSWGRYYDAAPDSFECGLDVEMLGENCLYDLTFTEAALNDACATPLFSQPERGNAICNGYSIGTDKFSLAITGSHQGSLFLSDRKVIKRWPLVGGVLGWDAATHQAIIRATASKLILLDVLTDEMRELQLPGPIETYDIMRNSWAFFELEDAADVFIDFSTAQIHELEITDAPTTSKGVYWEGNGAKHFTPDRRYMSIWTVPQNRLKQANPWVELVLFEQGDVPGRYRFVQFLKPKQLDYNTYFQYLGGGGNRVFWYTEDDDEDHGGSAPYYGHCHAFDLLTRENKSFYCPDSFGLYDGHYGFAASFPDMRVSSNGNFLAWELSDGNGSCYPGDACIVAIDANTGDYAYALPVSSSDYKYCYYMSFTLDESKFVCVGDDNTYFPLY